MKRKYFVLLFLFFATIFAAYYFNQWLDRTKAYATADALLDKHDYVAAIEIFSELAESDFRDTRMKMNDAKAGYSMVQAMEAIKQDDYSKAIPYLQLAIKLYSELAESNFKDTQMKLNDANAEYSLFQAKEAIKQNDYSKAIPHLQLAYDLQSTEEVSNLLSEARYVHEIRMGEAYVAKDDYTNAEKHYLSAKELRQTDEIEKKIRLNRAKQKQVASKFYYKGNRYFRNQDYSSALDYYDKTLAVSPHFDEALRASAEARRRLAEYPKTMYATSYKALMYPEPSLNSVPIRKNGFYIDDYGQRRPFKPQSLFKGETADVYEERGQWARVSFLGTNAWVLKKYLREEMSSGEKARREKDRLSIFNEVLPLTFEGALFLNATVKGNNVNIRVHGGEWYLAKSGRRQDFVKRCIDNWFLLGKTHNLDDGNNKWSFNFVGDSEKYLATWDQSTGVKILDTN